MTRWKSALPWIALALAYAFTIAELHRAYLSRGFYYHDVGLISDFMSSALHGRGFFRVYDYGINHLAWLFTPTLILFVPLFWLTESPSLVIFLFATASFFGYAILLYVVHLLLRRSLSNHEEAEAAWPWVGVLFAAFAGLSTYCWKANVSAHYESMYLLFASAMLAALLRGAGMRLLIPLLLLTLGTRPDAGLFLASQLLCLLLLPRNVQPDSSWLRKQIAILVPTALFYTVIVVKWISPWLGVGEQTHAIRLWSHLGSSFGEIALHVLAHPIEVLEYVRGSAFLKLNESLLFLPFLSPSGWLANLPGLILYTTNDAGKRMLEWYNSALLMPGLFIGAWAGQSLLYRLASWVRARGPRMMAQSAVLASLPAIAIYGSGFSSSLWAFHEQTKATRSDGVDPELGSSQIAWIDAFLSTCPDIHAVAADFHSLVFVPNRMAIASLQNFARTDAVILNPKGSPLLSGSESLFEFEGRLTQFHLVRQGSGLKAYVRNGIVCRSADEVPPQHN